MVTLLNYNGNPISSFVSQLTGGHPCTLSDNAVIFMGMNDGIEKGWECEDVTVPRAESQAARRTGRFWQAKLAELS